MKLELRCSSPHHLDQPQRRPGTFDCPADEVVEHQASRARSDPECQARTLTSARCVEGSLLRRRAHSMGVTANSRAWVSNRAANAIPIVERLCLHGLPGVLAESFRGS